MDQTPHSSDHVKWCALWTKKFRDSIYAELSQAISKKPRPPFKLLHQWRILTSAFFTHQQLIAIKTSTVRMSIFVVLLRGINVGGHIVKKQQLEEVFASLGFQNISTYRQSGNVIIETSETETEEIRKRIESKLAVVLGYNVAVFLRTIPELRKLIELQPFKDQEKEGASFLVTFLATTPQDFPFQLPFTIPKSTALILSTNGREIFSVTHGGGEGGLPNRFLESKLKMKATTRNMNIVMGIVGSAETTF